MAFHLLNKRWMKLWYFPFCSNFHWSHNSTRCAHRAHVSFPFNIPLLQFNFILFIIFSYLCYSHEHGAANLYRKHSEQRRGWQRIICQGSDFIWNETVRYSSWFLCVTVYYTAETVMRTNAQRETTEWDSITRLCGHHAMLLLRHFSWNGREKNYCKNAANRENECFCVFFLLTSWLRRQWLEHLSMSSNVHWLIGLKTAVKLMKINITADNWANEIKEDDFVCVALHLKQNRILYHSRTFSLKPPVQVQLDLSLVNSTFYTIEMRIFHWIPALTGNVRIVEPLDIEFNGPLSV